jgi:hypothetical protein
MNLSPRRIHCAVTIHTGYGMSCIARLRPVDTLETLAAPARTARGLGRHHTTDVKFLGQAGGGVRRLPPQRDAVLTDNARAHSGRTAPGKPTGGPE